VPASRDGICSRIVTADKKSEPPRRQERQAEEFPILFSWRPWRLGGSFTALRDPNAFAIDAADAREAPRLYDGVFVREIPNRDAPAKASAEHPARVDEAE